MNESLPRLWEATVARSPSSVAVTDAATGERWSRAALAEAALAWAGSFEREAGRSTFVRRRVAMSVPNGPGWLAAFLGLLSAGAVPAPIDPSEPGEAQLGAARAIGASLLWRGGRLERVPAGGAAPAGPRPASECLVKMTSGSSGAPKGIAFTHAQMAADGRQICETMGIRPHDANLAAIPLGYSYGLGNLVVPLILQGTQVICISSALPHALASDAARFSPTVFPAVPPILGALVASDVPRRSLSSLRLVISAGSPLPREVARSFERKFGARVSGFYGTSETGGIAFDAGGGATLAGRAVGRPLSGVRIALGRSGRFTVSSPAVRGRGSFPPADRATLNALGELVLLGRTDRVVKVAGRRVDLAEIESALRSVPGVRDAFAHLAGGPGAALSAAAVTALPPAEIRRLLRNRIASWKIPARIVALASFPATARGKTDAGGLRQILSAPRTATSISTLRAARQMSAPR
jgi:acyl-CoA synthetase (AMP-forming)/AMP-acid ligase II